MYKQYPTDPDPCTSRSSSPSVKNPERMLHPAAAKPSQNRPAPFSFFPTITKRTQQLDAADQNVKAAATGTAESTGKASVCPHEIVPAMPVIQISWDLG
ncbi:hypothetical protein KY284_028161 [Solanum tuberosum]|nr:hypothetical protein KY284_028161 [Solanum tuberosum]